MKRYVLAIDQGTTGTTALVLDHELQVLAKASCEFPQLYPKPGYVEHDPAAILNSVRSAIESTLEKAHITGDEILTIGITNQRETTLLWNRQTGAPLHNAIVWQCRRTAERCAALKAVGHEEIFRRRTGLLLDPYFSGTKLAWLLEHLPDARKQAEQGDVCFGTIDSFLVWQLSGGMSHVTDVSNASRTLMMNLQTLDWDDDLLSILGIPRAVLPKICSCSEIYGYTRGFAPLPDGIPIAGIAGDQQAALFGQACFQSGEAKCTYGTGCFMLLNTGDQPVFSNNGLLTTVAWKLGSSVTYALEGSAFIAGAAVQWLRDGLGLIQSAAEIEALAETVEDNGGLVFVPALTGLGAPHWRPEARGIIHGITRGTTKGHLARAVLEGIAFQNHDVLNAMQHDLQKPLSGLRVDGGASANNLLMQFQADLLGVQLVRPALIETTALGAAFFAGLAVGFWPNLESIRESWKEDRRFTRSRPIEEVAQLLNRWKSVVQKA